MRFKAVSELGQVRSLVMLKKGFEWKIPLPDDLVTQERAEGI